MNPLVACGRLLSRAFVNGLCNVSSCPATATAAAESGKDSSGREDDSPGREERRNAKSVSLTKGELFLLTAISGFPKDLSVGVTRPFGRFGRFGDDAFFVASHPISDVIGEMSHPFFIG